MFTFLFGLAVGILLAALYPVAASVALKLWARFMLWVG